MATAISTYNNTNMNMIQQYYTPIIQDVNQYTDEIYFKLAWTTETKYYRVNKYWTMRRFLDTISPLIELDFRLEQGQFELVEMGASENAEAIVIEETETLESMYGPNVNVSFYIRQISGGGGGGGGSGGSSGDCPTEYLCPIGLYIMTDPVIAVDGFTYERSEIQRWFDGGNRRSPKTNVVLDSIHLIPNFTLRSIIHTFQEQNR
jgi:hypothetical protein